MLSVNIRLVEPEILDQLREDDPQALRSRVDLRRLNSLMGNMSWLCDTLNSVLQPGDRVLELGAGDGAFAIDYLFPLFRTLSKAGRSCSYTGFDRWLRPPELPAEFDWIQGDILRYEDWEKHDVIIVNLLLHQFSDRELKKLGQGFGAHAHSVVANETARSWSALWKTRASFLLGLGYVSRHDALVSIRAGFRKKELPLLLGLESPAWKVSLHTTPMCAYRMIARKSLTQ